MESDSILKRDIHKRDIVMTNNATDTLRNEAAAFILRTWLNAYLNNDYATEEEYEVRVFDVVLSTDISPNVFREISPLYHIWKNNPYFKHPHLVLRRAFQNPACPVDVLEIGFLSNVTVYQQAVLGNSSTPADRVQDWQIMAFLNGAPS